MRVLGVVLQKNYLRYAVLEGDKKSPVLIVKGRQSTIDPNDVPSLMDWYETHFQQLIDDHVPDVIAYKLTLGPKLEQQHTLSYPFGILNLIAKKKNLRICEYSTRGIRPSKLSLPKDTNLEELCDSTFGANPPYWDKYQKEAILVAWFCL